MSDETKEVSDATVGKIVALDDEGNRTVFLLCSHISGNEWFVHQGSYDHGTLAAHPFQEKVLIRKDLLDDAWDTSNGTGRE